MKPHNISKQLFSAQAFVFAIASFSVSLPAQAQQASEDDDTGVIIVTAQKREQDIIDVPLAVSAIGDDVLRAAQVSDFTDVTRVSPSVTVTGGGNSASSVVALRGVGTFSFSTSAEPAVSVVVDDVALLQQGQAFGKLNDIARVEVLRGPQAVLFGKNASAGVINIVTNAPSRDFSGNIEGTLTDDDEARVTGTLSGPIGGDGGFRINAFYGDRKGYIRNLTTNTRLNNEEGWGVRGKFNYEFGSVEATIIADYSKSKSAGAASTYFYILPGTTQSGAAIDITGITPGLGNTNTNFDVIPIANSKQGLVSAKFDIDLGSATLTSISSYQDWKLDTLSDADASPRAFIFQGGPYHAQQFAQELRLTSSGSGPFDYIVGAYYADGNTDRTFVRSAPNGPAGLRQNWNSTAKTKTLAGFAQLGYELSSSTTINVGGRVNKEKIGVFFQDNRSTPPIIFAGTASDTAVTGKASLLQAINDDVNVYASVATGYKGQAYDISTGFSQARINNLVKPENSVAYEVGIKGRAWDNRASFSLVGFWTDYKDFQSQGVEFVGGAPQFILRNVGRLRTRGIEFEGTLRPADGLNLFTSAAYVDATIKSFPLAPCFPLQTAAQGCFTVPGSATRAQDLAGTSLANSPKFKFNIGGNYEQPIGSTPLTGFVTANYVWQSRVNFALDRNPRTVQPAYGIANVSIGLRESENRNWEVALFVNNLFDKAYAGSITDFTGNGYSSNVLVQQVPRNFDRYMGLRFRVGFGGSR